MLSRLRARWLVLALLASVLLPAVSIALTWANAQFTRRLLREQVEAPGADRGRAWRTEIAELGGGLAATVCRLRLFDRRFPGLGLELDGKLQHRLLSASFAGEIYLLGGPDGSPQQTPERRTGLASFQGQARYHPVAGVVWSARVKGQRVRLGMEGLEWTLEPWSAVLAGDRTASISLTLPVVQAKGARLGGATIRGVQLELIDFPREAGGSGLHLSGHARVESLELRLPRGLADAFGMILEGHIERAPDSWPFELKVSAAELVHKGFPFTRVSDLSYRVDGLASLVALHGRGDLAAGSGSFAWHSRQSLEADSDYGHWQGHALMSGTRDPSDVPRVSELRLTGVIPQGLWSVLERLNAQFAARLVGAGLVKLGGGEVSVGAQYRGGRWHTLVAEP